MEKCTLYVWLSGLAAFRLCALKHTETRLVQILKMALSSFGNWKEKSRLKMTFLIRKKKVLNNKFQSRNTLFLQKKKILVCLLQKQKANLIEDFIKKQHVCFPVLNTWKEIYKLSLSSCPLYTSVCGRTRGFSAFSSTFMKFFLFPIVRRPPGFNTSSGRCSV